jgi:hypothetical protein
MFPNNALFAHATAFTRMAEFQQISDVEPWERGVPRERTMMMPASGNTILAAGTDP